MQPRILEWMRRKAALADGTCPGVPVVSPLTVISAVDGGAASAPNWTVHPSRKGRCGWNLMKAGLLRDLLTMADAPPPREKMLSLVDSVLQSADRCGGITHRLLGFAKHMDVERESINLDLLLREVLGFLEKEASYRNIGVEFKYTDEPPRIVSDRGQLQQVFLNIINNAFAAVEDGGRIELDIRRAERDKVAVSISDNGVGIAESHLEHIFDPFFTTKKGAGTGLGLSITYGIVQKLGGQITVKSKAGEGTCFTVTLPVSDEPE